MRILLVATRLRFEFCIKTLTLGIIKLQIRENLRSPTCRFQTIDSVSGKLCDLVILGLLLESLLMSVSFSNRRNVSIPEFLRGLEEGLNYLLSLSFQSGSDTANLPYFPPEVSRGVSSLVAHLFQFQQTSILSQDLGTSPWVERSWVRRKPYSFMQ